MCSVLREKQMPSMILSTKPYDFSSSFEDASEARDETWCVGDPVGVSRISIVISRESNVITIGEVVIDVHGIEMETELQIADVTFIIDCSFDTDDGDNKNSEASVSSFNSKLWRVIFEEEVDN